MARVDRECLSPISGLLLMPGHLHAHVIGQGAMVQDPLAICREGNPAEEQKQKGSTFHLAHGHSYHLSDTDRSAAPNALAVTIATGPCAAPTPWTFSPLLFWS